MTNQHEVDSSLTHESLLTSIPNSYPLIATHVSLTYPFAQLCPISGEPQAGSTITISYDASKALLETKSLRAYLASFAGENVHGVRDLEETVQVVAQHCADVLRKPVQVIAHYHLKVGEMKVDVRVEPRA